MFCASLHSCCRSEILQPRSDPGCALVTRHRPTVLATVAISAQPRAEQQHAHRSAGDHGRPLHAGRTVHRLHRRADRAAARSAGVDVRGAAPATSETDLLDSGKNGPADLRHLAVRRQHLRSRDAWRSREDTSKRKRSVSRTAACASRSCRRRRFSTFRSATRRIRPGADCGYRAAQPRQPPMSYRKGASVRAPAPHSANISASIAR